jgi:putative ATPase
MQNQMGLFNDSNQNNAPLAYKVRPKDLKNYQGQKAIRSKIDKLNFKTLPHIVFFGPPGSGKTTLAQILAHEANIPIINFNAVMGGVNDLRVLIKEALQNRESQGVTSIIFIDEIHRFNKAQQDALLPIL